jgi:hypothetical protein
LCFSEKVIIGGNHDFALQELSRQAVSAVLSNCTYVKPRLSLNV